VCVGGGGVGRLLGRCGPVLATGIFQSPSCKLQWGHPPCAVWLCVCRVCNPLARPLCRQGIVFLGAPSFVFMNVSSSVQQVTTAAATFTRPFPAPFPAPVAALLVGDASDGAGPVLRAVVTTQSLEVVTCASWTRWETTPVVFVSGVGPWCWPVEVPSAWRGGRKPRAGGPE
jgi:hypothetical protein